MSNHLTERFSTIVYPTQASRQNLATVWSAGKNQKWTGHLPFATFATHQALLMTCINSQTWRQATGVNLPTTCALATRKRLCLLHCWFMDGNSIGFQFHILWDKTACAKQHHLLHQRWWQKPTPSAPGWTAEIRIDTKLLSTEVSFFLRGKCEELQKSARMTSTLQLNPGTSWHAQHLVESLVRGCTSWSNTIATPLIPAVKVRAKALSMGSFPKSAPMFHWLFAWATFTNRSKPSFTGCLAPKGEWNIFCFATKVQTYLQHGGPSTYNGMIRHACSTAMLLKQAWNIMKQWWWASPPSCERTNPICCINPRSGPLFGQSMALDGMHEMRKAGAPGMGPYPEQQGGLEQLGQRAHKQ